jgi:multidrug efflux system outer membrane protein
MPSPVSIRACAFTLLVALSGCVMGPHYERPNVGLPQEWPPHVLLSEADAHEWQAWWNRYDDPTLQRLVEQALQDNLTLQLWAGRIREARAQLGFTRADRYPTLDAQADAQRQRQAGLTLAGPVAPEPGVLDQLAQIEQSLQSLSQPIDPNTSGLQVLRDAAQLFQDDGTSIGRGPIGNVLSVSAVLGYEVDLWGHLARQQETAEALLEQSVFAHDAVRLQVIADVVTVYVNMRAAQAQLAITERTVTSREESYALEKIRHEGGATDALTMRQAEVQLEAARARIPSQRERVLLLQSALGILVGLSPAELMEELDPGPGSLDALVMPDGVPADLPSEMLQRRPDIRAAEAGLIAANAQIGVAEASRLPRLNLAAFLGSTAFEFGDLFSGPAETGGLSASVAGPVLDFGRNRARVETAEAQRDQAETQYRITIAQAFREVRDALIAYDAATARAEAVQRQIDAVRESLRLAETRYEAGYIAFIEVLDAQRVLLDAELVLTEARRDRLLATATLFKALGGGFT